MKEKINNSIINDVHNLFHLFFLSNTIFFPVSDASTYDTNFFFRGYDTHNIIYYQKVNKL